jgi:hypothetical protein
MAQKWSIFVQNGTKMVPFCSKWYKNDPFLFKMVQKWFLFVQNGTKSVVLTKKWYKNGPFLFKLVQKMCFFCSIKMFPANI